MPAPTGTLKERLARYHKIKDQRHRQEVRADNSHSDAASVQCGLPLQSARRKEVVPP